MRENILMAVDAPVRVAGDNAASGTPNAAQRSASNDAPAPEVDIAPSAPAQRP